jgi:hypothetical protein
MTAASADSASVKAWLEAEIIAGRLAPALNESQLVVIAGVVRASNGAEKKTPRGSTSAAREVTDGSGLPKAG